MSRTLTLTATAAAIAKEEEAPKPSPLIDARLIDALFARGVRAVPSARAGEFLYTRDASSSPIIIATAVRFADDGAVDKAFTRGDFTLSDNFDAVAGGAFVAVENLTFGPAKTFLERRETVALILDRAHWTRERVLASLPQFAKGVDRLASLEEARPEYRALQEAPDSALARLDFIEALARRHLADVHKAVLDFGRKKGVGLEDPVFAAADEHLQRRVQKRRERRNDQPRARQQSEGAHRTARKVNPCPLHAAEARLHRGHTRVGVVLGNQQRARRPRVPERLGVAS
jgi:hypothetical protein